MKSGTFIPTIEVQAVKLTDAERVHAKRIAGNDRCMVPGCFERFAYAVLRRTYRDMTDKKFMCEHHTQEFAGTALVQASPMIPANIPHE